MIKRIIGRPIEGYKDNIRRNIFNELLRKEYEGKEPLFDLAMTESIFPNGSKVAFKKEGRSFSALAPTFTDDCGHLNKIGRMRAAE